MGGRKRLAIYDEPFGGGIGGSEYCAAVLAAGLANDFDVEILHHKPEVTRESMTQVFGEDLSRVSVRHVPPSADWLGPNGSPWWRSATAQRRWKAEFSEGSDALVTICHWIPPYCHADMGILYVLFPLFPRPRVWPWAAEAAPRVDIKGMLRRMYLDREWKRRFDSYESVATISEFSQKWTRQWWGCESSIIYPPVDVRMDCGPKENVVLAIGRYTEMKRQLEMIQTFRRLKTSRHQASAWRMECCGNPHDAKYYQTLENAAHGDAIELVVGADRDEIKRRLATSKIFWHAAGYGIDEQESPDRTEHFGIVTVEAMAAGCVPVVIGKGGQPEIVEHGVSGFVWNELEELEEYTQRLIQDDELRRSMSEAARTRAQHFSKERFLAGFRSLLSSRLSNAS